MPTVCRNMIGRQIDRSENVDRESPNYKTQRYIIGAYTTDYSLYVLLFSQLWPIPSMSRRVINCVKLCLSSPFGRIQWIRQWAVDRDPVLTSTTSAKIGQTAIASPAVRILRRN